MQVLFGANSFPTIFADCFCAVHALQLEFANFSLPFEDRFKHCLHGRSFICNRIGFDAVTHLSFTGAGRVRYQNWVVLKTLSKVERFQNDTVSLVV